MKKIVLLVLLGLFLAGTQSFSQMKCGANAGLNIANVVMSPSGGNSPKSVTGFHAGVFCDYMIMKSLGVGAGLFYTTRGSKSEMTVFTTTATMTTTLSYLEIPITGKYYFDAGPAKIFVAAGPYVAYGLGGKMKTEQTGQPSETTTVKWGSGENDNVKSMDAGLTFGAGAEISKFIVALNYDLGLSNMIPKPVNSETMKSRVFGISVGYIFCEH